MKLFIKKPVHGEVWPIAKDREVTTAVRQELSIYQFGDFLWRRYIAFMSWTSSTFREFFPLILVWLCICVYNMYTVQLNVPVHSLVRVCMVDIPLIVILSQHLFFFLFEIFSYLNFFFITQYGYTLCFRMVRGFDRLLFCPGLVRISIQSNTKAFLMITWILLQRAKYPMFLLYVKEIWLYYK
jgi:hypothetical protein